jgi:hypothetical protein
VSGRFPLITDENITGPLVQGLRARGWDVVRTIEVFGQRSVDEPILIWAVEHGRAVAAVFVTGFSLAMDSRDDPDHGRALETFSRDLRDDHRKTSTSAKGGRPPHGRPPEKLQSILASILGAPPSARLGP